MKSNYNSMRSTVQSLSLILLVIILTAGVVSAKHNTDVDRNHYCVVSDEGRFVTETVAEQTTCYALLEPEDQAIHNISNYTGDDIGYCCGVSIGNEENNGEYTRAYCNSEGGSLSTDTGVPKAEACTPSSESTEKRFTGSVINISSGNPVTGAAVNITYTYTYEDTRQQRTSVVSTDSSGKYNTTYTVPQQRSRESASLTVTSPCYNTTSALPTGNPVTTNISICGSPGDEADDPPGEATVCGNGIVEGEEACDPGNGSDPEFADDIPEDTPRVCLNNCEVRYEEKTCESGECTPECCGTEICQNPDSSPKLTCRPQLCNNPSLDVYTTNAGLRDGNYSVDISWNTPSVCDPSTKQLNITGPNAVIESTILGEDQNSYQFEADARTLNDSEQYTVTVAAQFGTTKATNTSTFTPRIICAGRADTTTCTYSGNQSAVLECDENLNADIDPCAPNQACQNPPDRPASCKTARCESCSGPNSLFSSTKLRPTIDQSSCAPAFANNLCYYEPASQRNTVRGQAEQCDSVRTCADYQSRTSCETNPCNNDRTATCDWNTLNEGLGRGFCAPNETEDATSSLCHQCGNDGCDRSLCEDEIGDIGGQTFCYFNNDAAYADGEPINPSYNKYRCMARPESGCATYDSQKACLNGSSVEIDERNQRTSESDDHFGYGVCEWSPGGDDGQPRCFKDSNANDQPDCGPLGSVNSRCVQDLTAPDTVVEGLSNGDNITTSQLSLLGFKATDNEYGRDSISTTVSYDGETYTTNHESQLKTAIRASERTEHTFTYWSEDGANNPEVKQDFQLTVYQRLGDILNLSAEVNTYSIEDTTTANITARVGELPVTDERTLSCRFELRGNNGVTRSESGQGSQVAQTTMGYVESGQYNLESECFTDRGGSYNETVPVRVDTDPRITNTSPYGETFRAGEVTLEADTSVDRNCEYRDSTGDWERFDTTGTTEHSTTVTREPDDGVVIHELRCEDPDTEETVYGDNADTIMYAVDESTPDLSINVTKDGEQVNPDTRIEADSVQARITCSDKPSLEYRNNSYSFGCGDISYCVETQNDTCSAEAGAPISSPITVEAADNRTTAENDYHPVETIYVDSKDIGGNRELREFGFNLTPSYDLSPPTTTLSDLPGPEQRITPERIYDAQLSATDNTDSAADITTYVRYNGSTKSGDNNLGWLKGRMQNNPSNTHTFSYWSVDSAGNEGTHKEHTVALYPDYTSSLALTLSNGIYNDETTGEARGRITATVGELIGDDDRGVSCDFTIDQNTTAEDEGRREATTTFNDLDEGNHRVDANCTGSHDGSFGATKTARIDLSPAIQNTTPYYDPVGREEITISAETTEPRTCQYRQNGWTDFETTGGTNHTDTIVPEREGIITHDVRCSNGSAWITGGETDIIAYGVDTSGPTANITVEGPNGTKRDSSLPIVANNVNVGVTCIDQPDQSYNGETINHGCKETMYVCQGTQDEACTPPQDQNLTQGTFELTSREDQSITETIRVRTEDNNGNQEITTKAVELVDDSLNISVEIRPR